MKNVIIDGRANENSVVYPAHFFFHSRQWTRSCSFDDELTYRTSYALLSANEMIFLKKGAQLSSFIRKEILGEKNSSIKTVENSVPSQIISNIFDLISPPQSLMIMINSPEKIHENDFDLLHTK